MNLNEIKNTFNTNNKSDITNLLSYLCDCFESYATFENVNLVIEYLCEKFKTETDEIIREMILDTLQAAVTYTSDIEFDFTCLSDNMNSLSENLILGIIAIYECSCDKKYITVLENICYSGSEIVAKESRNAIIELQAM